MNHLQLHNIKTQKIFSKNMQILQDYQILMSLNFLENNVGMRLFIVRQVSTYSTLVTKENGEKQISEVTRIGQFSAFSEGKYLEFSSDTNTLYVLQTQPSSSAQSAAKEFQENKNTPINIMIDPTREHYYSMLANSPTLLDRIHQGGLLDILLFLGGLGILFAIYKIIVLNKS